MSRALVPEAKSTLLLSDISKILTLRPSLSQFSFRSTYVWSDGFDRYVSGNPQYRGYDILPIISALNIILAAHPSRTASDSAVMVGRNRFFFPSLDRPVSLGGGLEAFRGFYSSVRPSYNQLMVNVNGENLFNLLISLD